MTRFKVWIDVEEWDDVTDESHLLDPPFASVAVFDSEDEAMAFAERLQNLGRSIDDDDALCPECERSNGPHYRGPCEHGGAR